jgi:calcineurin-like phosphoesterase family protein
VIWFTSDLHFSHQNVIGYCNRPYASIDEMNEELIRNWNQCVSPTDEIYCLGDVSMSFKPIELYSARLNGKKYLVPGNHDFCHSVHKKSKNPESRARWVSNYEQNGWIVLPEQTTLEISGVGAVNLCHLPYAGDHVGEERYPDKRPADDGKWLLCGHVHNHWKQKDRMINVGVDVWDMKPVSVDELGALILNLKRP